MQYSSINKTKWGDCTNPDCGCGGKDIPVIKVGRIYYCQSSHQRMKADEQMDRVKKRNAVRTAKQKVNKLILDNPSVKAPKDYAEMDRWFKDVRKKLTGRCQCGCNKPSSKMDDRYFKHSCCHVFPKSKFASIKTHPRNFVERAFWGGCHSVMDDTSMDRWVTFADWGNIKEIFHELAPLLTDEERATKFYSHFEKLIYQ